MKVLVINCGSSSIKYSCFDEDDLTVVAQGLVERVGEPGSKLTHKVGDARYEIERDVADHAAGLALIAAVLVDPDKGVLGDLSEVVAVGHRVVHGGEEFVKSTRIDDDVIAAIERCIELGPLHNPPNLAGIRATMASFPDAVQVAVFDTAFHQTMPRHAFMYATPYSWYEDLRVRRYGFHGTSHRYVAGRAARLLGKAPEACNLITCHLGNGASITAVRGGRSVDTSMGLTPLEGLVMGTRSGDIDPAIIPFVMGRLDAGADDVGRSLNRESGLVGVSGLSNDMRNLLEAARDGNERAQLAIDIFCYRLKKYIGAYLAVLGATDCVVFTGGIGENAAPVRAMALDGLAPLGICLDDARNQASDGDRFVSADDSPVKVAVICTDEEKMIAMDTVEVLRED